MSVDQTNLIDIINIDRKSGSVVLNVSDHLDWSDTVNHQSILQAKFNAYLAFVQGGEILERYPDAKGRAIVFEVVFKFRPDQEGIKFLSRAKEVIESAGIDFRYSIFAESYDN